MGENPCPGGNDTVLCESIAFAFTQCAVSEGKIIITAWVAVQHSRSPVSILRKSISGRHRLVRVADGLMTARCRFT